MYNNKENHVKNYCTLFITHTQNTQYYIIFPIPGDASLNDDGRMLKIDDE